MKGFDASVSLPTVPAPLTVLRFHVEQRSFDVSVCGVSFIMVLKFFLYFDVANIAKLYRRLV